MSATLSALVGEINTMHKEVKHYFDAADANGGDMSADDVVKVKDLNKRIEEKSEQAARLKEVKELRGDFDARDQKAIGRLGLGAVDDREEKAVSTANQSPAEQFVNDPGFKQWVEGLKVNGHVSDRAKIQSPGIQVKALVTSVDGSGGAFMLNDRTAIVDASYQRPLTIMDLVTRGQTSGDVVEYVRQGTPTNNAAPVAEAALVAAVYVDTPQALHAMALRSLRAHLLKLREDGRVRGESGGAWQVVA